MQPFSLNGIPDGPGVYALYEHERPMLVGSAPNLRSLAEAHLAGSRGPSDELREVLPHPERITLITWWQHPAMAEDGRRNAARWVAVEVLAPVIRPPFRLSTLGETALKDPEFVKAMNALFHAAPSGFFVPQSVSDLARTVYELKDKVEELERRLAGKS